jgi:hypothetical protein
MDKRVFRLAIITIFSAFILVMVVVYATNAKRINELLGSGSGKAPAATETAEDATETDGVISADETSVYGEQIGDNLSGFLADDDFFDDMEEIPTVVVIQRNGPGDGVVSGSYNGADAATGSSTDSVLSNEDGMTTPDEGDGISGSGAEAANTAGTAVTDSAQGAATDAAVTGSSVETETTDGSGLSSTQPQGTGMAVVGQLINPNATPEGTAGSGAASDSSGYLTTVPQAPPGGFGEYIPAEETIGGTPVGTVP